MPWITPTLKEVRGLVRDSIRGSLPGADASIPNSVLRVLSDCQGALCHLTLQYIDWLALQLIPDTAETEWLDRHGDIWLTNADGTTGRKMATLAYGTVAVTGDFGAAIPVGARLNYAGTQSYEVLQTTIILASAAVPVPVRSLDQGSAGNLPIGSGLTFATEHSGIDSNTTIIDLRGGTDEENDNDLRIRVLERIRQPPMGGAEHDYVAWAKAVPGVTRAWCAGNEMGMGTVTVRFMCDELRADNDGFPLPQDIEAVTTYIDYMRPVTVKDRWVVAPLKQFVDVVISNLIPDTTDNRAAIESELLKMLRAAAAPGQTIFAAWKSYAVMSAPNVVSFNLTNTTDDIMESPGHMALLGDIIYD